MLNQEERELIGYVQALKIMIKNKTFIETISEEATEKELEEFLLKILEPIIEAIGETRFHMGEISHLSCKIGSTKKRFKETYPTFEPITET